MRGLKKIWRDSLGEKEFQEKKDLKHPLLEVSKGTQKNLLIISYCVVLICLFSLSPSLTFSVFVVF